MALDNAQFISELSITDPPGTDELSEGDDQIRTTKRATFQSFPFVDAQVDLTAAELNALSDAALKSVPNTFTQQQDYQAAIVVANNIPLQGRDSVGGLQHLCSLNAADESVFGDIDLPMNLVMGTLGTVSLTGVTVANFTSLNFGSLLVSDRSGILLKAGFRNPRTIVAASTRSIVQDDEGTYISVGSGVTLTVEALEAGTQIDILAVSAGVTLVEGSGVTLFFLDGSGSPPSGTRTIALGSIVHLNWDSASFVEIWGNGIT